MEKWNLLPDDCTIDWSKVRDVLRGRKVKLKTKTTLLQLLCGTTPTSEWLNEPGFRVKPLATAHVARSTTATTGWPAAAQQAQETKPGSAC